MNLLLVGLNDGEFEQDVGGLIVRPYCLVVVLDESRDMGFDVLLE
ncbi:hypothetical protein ABID21_000468 [Pseudorhizobium tarimense]|uniref:Uncharacterized protein n=1 Tax=Pseudorhizobium tarimense TaxID=1079109 RepID=A0ABV2H1H2_9HYPH|nr:hypothetical protein [Pseudorhizobium tarimense]